MYRLFSHPLQILCLLALVELSVVSVMFGSRMHWLDFFYAVQIALPTGNDRGLEYVDVKMIDESMRSGFQPVPRLKDAPFPDANKNLLRKVTTLRSRIEERYGIEVVMFDPSFLSEYGVDAYPYPLEALVDHLHSLHDWLQLYPPSFIQNIGLKRVALFKGWERNHTQAAGFLLDPTSIGLEVNPIIFHHEVFHMSDIHDGGLQDENTQWLQAKYGNNIPDQKQDVMDALAKRAYEEERPFGFASAYGKYGGTDEDQATTAEMLMSYPALVQEWAANEPPLFQSIAFLKEFYFLQSDGLMDEAYWLDRMKDVHIDELYWNKHRQLQNSAGALSTGS